MFDDFCPSWRIVEIVFGHQSAWRGNDAQHPVDPRTGRPRSGMLSATVIGPTATGTDALSTGLLVMGVDEARKLRGRHPELRAILVPEPPDGEPAPIWLGGGEAPWENGSKR